VHDAAFGVVDAQDALSVLVGRKGDLRGPQGDPLHVPLDVASEGAQIARGELELVELHEVSAAVRREVHAAIVGREPRLAVDRRVCRRRDWLQLAGGDIEDVERGVFGR
jgi:hypothetical protein